MCGGANGQELRQPFHDGQDDGLDDSHIWLRLGGRLAFPENRKDLDHKSRQDQDRGERNPPEAIDLIFIEHIRVRALAASPSGSVRARPVRYRSASNDNFPSQTEEHWDGFWRLPVLSLRRSCHGCLAAGVAVLVAGSSRFFFCRCHEDDDCNYWACNIRESPFRPKYPQ